MRGGRLSRSGTVDAQRVVVAAPPMVSLVMPCHRRSAAWCARGRYAVRGGRLSRSGAVHAQQVVAAPPTVSRMVPCHRRSAAWCARGLDARCAADACQGAVRCATDVRRGAARCTADVRQGAARCTADGQRSGARGRYAAHADGRGGGPLYGRRSAQWCARSRYARWRSLLDLDPRPINAGCARIDRSRVKTAAGRRTAGPSSRRSPASRSGCRGRRREPVPGA